ncbi:hypothetical protein SAMN05216327_101554 [Dyadobacter sp. SG02]|uniref:DUF6934 family protein n=1 Tax=Dyadobacter sp. SG02 TaxID=1855291 RepID=UPI0008C9810A|nr:hypothetical protein [Dyadobacter sp. SG02]SEI43663.1 hypothetical protein SAMN05216327_101554 [Dyadobacter sp. SG02]
MKEQAYPFQLVQDQAFYEFTSVSANKKIEKAVLLEQSRTVDRLFNLALMDADDDGEFSDEVESRNGDLKMVLATIFRIVEHFLDRRSDVVVGFRGNDERRHRLYRIAIAYQLQHLTGRFEIYGGKNNAMFLFEPNTAYEYYYIKKYSYEP